MAIGTRCVLYDDLYLHNMLINVCQTPPPLEVPMHSIETLAELLHNSTNFEWDNREAASPFSGAF